MFESADILLVRRNPRILGIAALPLMLALALIATRSADGMLLAALVIASIYALLFVYRKNWHPSVQLVAIRADGQGIKIGGRFIPRTQIRTGLIMPGLAPRLVLRRRFRLTIELQMESLAEARSLLSALDLDASQTAADFHGVSWILASWGYFLAALLVVIVTGLVCWRVGAPARLDGALIWLGMAFLLVPTRIRVGSEGIELRWLWMRRFIGYGEIGLVTVSEQIPWPGTKVVALRIQGRSGVVVVPIGARTSRDLLPPLTPLHATAALACERIREASSDFEHRRTAARTPAAPRLPEA